MDKQQDADLEKGFETIEEAQLYFEDEHAAYFDDRDDDLFDEHVSSEDELDYEPDGAFLD